MRFGDAGLIALAWSAMKMVLAMGAQGGIRYDPNAYYELREDTWPEVREDGNVEVRDAQ